jgi:phosphoribosylglycinamide formyltransferase-1
MPNTNKLNVAVLASTKATDLEAVIAKVKTEELNINIPILISDKKEAFCLERARGHGIEAMFINPEGKTREEYDQEVMRVLKEYNIDLVLLIGYMKFISKPFLDEYRNKIINIHPSLLPSFPGTDRSVHKEIIEHGCKVSGCTAFFIDEGADTGPIILQKSVPVTEEDTVDTLKAKVQEAEQEVLPEAVRLFAEGRLQVEGRKVNILPRQGV